MKPNELTTDSVSTRLETANVRAYATASRAHGSQTHGTQSLRFPRLASSIVRNGPIILADEEDASHLGRARGEAQ